MANKSIIGDNNLKNIIYSNYDDKTFKDKSMEDNNKQHTVDPDAFIISGKHEHKEL